MELLFWAAYVVGVLADPFLWVIAWIIGGLVANRWQALLGGVLAGLAVRFAAWQMSQRIFPFDYWDGAFAAAIAGAIATIVIHEIARIIRRRRATSSGHPQ